MPTEGDAVQAEYPNLGLHEQIVAAQEIDYAAINQMAAEGKIKSPQDLADAAGVSLEQVPLILANAAKALTEVMAQISKAMEPPRPPNRAQRRAMARVKKPLTKVWPPR